MRSVLALLALLQAPGRYYWPMTVDALASATVHTHVQVTGLVTLVRHEKDGDVHIKLVGKTKFVVAECVPKLPCKIPSIGQRVTVLGISRFDWEHKWWEVHPVEEIR